MNDLDFIDILSKCDVRIKDLAISKDIYSFDILAYKIILKKPFDSIKIGGTFSIPDTLKTELNWYHPFILYLQEKIKREIDEVIVKYSYELVEKEEVKEQDKVKYLQDQIVTTPWISQKDLEKSIFDFEEVKSLAQKFYKNINYESTESGVLKPNKVVKKEKPVTNYMDMLDDAWPVKNPYIAFDPATEVLSTQSAKYVKSPPPKLKVFSSEVVGKIAQVCPGINEVVRCPGCKRARTLYEIIIHLNDGGCHKPWSREEVADWIESLDVNTEIIGAIK